MKDSYIGIKSVASGTLEFSVTWDKVEKLLENVKQIFHETCNSNGSSYALISSRISQIYDSGVCTYVRKT